MTELPPLPEPDLHEGIILRDGGKYAGTEDGYTAESVRSIVAAAVAKERERIAGACERFASDLTDGDLAEALRDIAALIRATQATPQPPAAS